MSHGNNLREFSRSPLTVTAVITSDSGETASGETRDVSLNGIKISSPIILAEGTSCAVALLLKMGEQSISIDARGTITRCADNEMAVAFSEVSADSLEHLRNLVLYNSPDGELADREFDSHLGLKARRR